MGLLDRIRGGKGSGPGVQGLLGYFGLGDWWLTSFTEDERRYIQEKHKPMGESPDSLTRGDIGSTTQTAAGFLLSLSSWFVGPGNRHLAIRILEKADSLAGSEVLDRHFVCSQMIEVFHRERETDPAYLDAALAACRRQIAIAPEAARAWQAEYGPPLPDHRGFEQLAIVLERQADYEEAIRLCEEAKAQGWGGDWDKRIAQCRSKAGKSGKK